MASNAMNAFGMVLDNSSELEKEIRAKIIELLDINSKDEHLTEYIQECVSNFNVSNIEHNYIENIRKVIDEELSKIQQQKKENGIVDYSLISQSLTNRLRQLQNQDINLDDDFKDLATQISNKFPLCGITQEQFLSHFNSKKEIIAQTIKTYNKGVTGTLIKLTPQLVQDLKQLEIKNQNKNQSSYQSQNIESLKEKKVENEPLQSQRPTNINPHDTIELVRQRIFSKGISAISLIKSANPFNEFYPIALQDFQQELAKYNISVDESYINGIVSQLNLELGRQLVNKAKSNILQDVISSSNENINLLNNEELIQKYGINIDSKYMSEIIEYVNNGITMENQKRSSSIQKQQVSTNDNETSLKDSDNNVSNIYDLDDLFIKHPGYKRLYECFIELAETDIQKDAIEQIMKNGEYNGFKLNSMLSNEKYSKNAEIERRIAFAEMILHDENLFFYLVNNGLNVFHGTKIDALQTILSEGLFSSSELSKREIQLRTGEEQAMNTIFGGNIEKRNFISLTDDFDTAVSYAGFPYEEQTEYAKKYYGKELTSDGDIPIIICLNGNDIEQQHGESLVTVKSTCNEIGVNSSINPSDIKCIITSYDKIEYVKSLVSKYGIDVLGYNHNNKFQKRLINDKIGKFYSILKSNIEIDEQVFESCKEVIKETLKKSKSNETMEVNSSSPIESYDEMMEELNNQSQSFEENNINGLLNNSSVSNVSDNKNLSDDLSMTIASEVKMDIAFDLVEQYNNGVPVVPIIADNLIVKYNINERVAERLASEINTMVESYIHQKEQNENYTPYVLDGFDEETQGISRNHR